MDHSCGALPLVHPLLQASLPPDRPSPRQPVVGPSPPPPLGPSASAVDATRNYSTRAPHGNGTSPQRLAATRGRFQTAGGASGHAAEPPVTNYASTAARVADVHQRQPLQQISTAIARPQPTLEWPNGLEPSRRPLEAGPVPAHQIRQQQQQRKQDQQQQQQQQSRRHPVPAAEATIDNLGGRLQRLRIPPLPSGGSAPNGNGRASAGTVAGRTEGATRRPASIQPAEARGGLCPTLLVYSC